MKKLLLVLGLIVAMAHAQNPQVHEECKDLLTMANKVAKMVGKHQEELYQATTKKERRIAKEKVLNTRIILIEINRDLKSCNHAHKK